MRSSQAASWHGWLCLAGLIVPACGDGVAIRGFASTVYLTEGEESEVPEDLRAAEITAIAFDDGDLSLLSGVGKEDGTFEIEGDTPAGEYLLRLDRGSDSWLRGEYYAASGDQPRLTRYALGRADAVRSREYGTGLAFDVTDLAPWRASDRLVIVSFDAGTWVAWTPTAEDGIIEGATNLRADFEYSAHVASDVGLIDAGHGDTGYVLQVTGETTDLGYASRAERSLALTELEQLPGELAPVTGPLAEIDQASIEVEYDGAGFASMVAQVGRDAFIGSCGISMSAFPWRATQGLCPAPGCPVVGLLAPDECDHAIAATLVYGAAFPEEWLGVEASLWLHVPVAVDGAAAHLLSIWLAVEPTAPADGSVELAPAIGVVAEPRVDGGDAYADQAVGETPLVSWAAPELGAADRYEVEVLRLYADSGWTRAERAAWLETSGTALRIPPGVLHEGDRFVVLIRSRALGHDGAVAGEAAMVSGVLTVQ